MSDETFLYLTTIGRKSGEPRHIEIWFVELEGRYYMCSEGRERSHWVQNIGQNPQVTFSVGTRADHGALVPLTPAKGRLLHPDQDQKVVQAVAAQFDQKYQWSEGLFVELTPEGVTV